MNRAFSVGHLKSEMLTRHPRGDVQEAVKYAEMVFRRGDKLDTKKSESSVYK